MNTFKNILIFSFFSLVILVLLIAASELGDNWFLVMLAILFTYLIYSKEDK